MSLDLLSIVSQFNIKMFKPSVSKIYEFEDFRLDAAHLMLYRGNEEISLAPKAVQTLLVLVEQCGEILSKDALMETIWKDSFVEESNLTQYIHILRKILGTSADGKPLIETLRRRGYRFNGDVRCVENVEKDSTKEISDQSPTENGNLYHPVSESVQLLENTASFETPVSRTGSENKIDLPAEKKRRRIVLKAISLTAFVCLLMFAGFAFFIRETKNRPSKPASRSNG
jgi:DNA-binding winged helix-turn-helix (wHTH) protein